MTYKAHDSLQMLLQLNNQMERFHTTGKYDRAPRELWYFSIHRLPELELSNNTVLAHYDKLMQQVQSRMEPICAIIERDYGKVDSDFSNWYFFEHSLNFLNATQTLGLTHCLPQKIVNDILVFKLAKVDDPED